MPDSRRRTRYVVQAAVAVVLLAAGVAAGIGWSERRAGGDSARNRDVASPSASSTVSTPPTPGMPSASSSSPAVSEPVEISLAPEAVTRAGIKTAVVMSRTATAALTVPATVMSNAYRDTKVNALVGGIVRHVSAELGTPVRRGQPLAEIFSAELADAQMKYLSMQATLHADHQKRVRTQKLAELGAVSRQELEEITAIHAAHETEVAAARQRLLLLGLSADRVAALRDASHVLSEVTVSAPAAGVVVARTVNPGQVVSAGHELFIVTDLSTVWVIGDLYERDFGRVRVGADAAVSVPSQPGAPPRRGRVTYIDPRVDAATRTAKVRVEVANGNDDLKLGMFLTLGFDTGGGERVTTVPHSAVQAIGERSVVYVAVPGGDGRFIERFVKVGPPVGDHLQILEGLKPGERIVTEGSFFLRSEAARSRAGT